MNSDLLAISVANGMFTLPDLPPGQYQLSAAKDELVSSSTATIDLAPGQVLQFDLMLTRKIASISSSSATNVARKGFFVRFADAHVQEWKGTSASDQVPRRGYPAPVDSPPYPFAHWPYGGLAVVGTVDTSLFPLMQALDSGPHGEPGSPVASSCTAG